MTWTGYFTVQDVSDGPAPIDVLCAASADETAKPFAGHADEKFAATEAPALNSNTEGKLRSAELRLVFNEDESPLAIGDLVYVTGHFTKRAPTEIQED